MNLLELLGTKERIFLGLFLVIKIAIIFSIPFTGDEAYFTTWATNPSLGYYDHQQRQRLAHV